MAAPTKDAIDLFRGWPNASLLPVSQIKAAADSALSDSSIFTPGLLYGPDDGFEPLRRSIATWLSEFYRAFADPIPLGRICISGGASQNLASILQAFSDPLYTRHVWMISPTYYHACRVFEDGAFAGRLRSVPEDREGVDIDYLRQALDESEGKPDTPDNSEPRLRPPRPERKAFRHLIYLVPTFSNPSGSCMSLRRREQLVRLAREHDALIITDDVYDQLQWPAEDSFQQTPLFHACLPRMVDVDRFLDGGTEREGADGFGNAISNGSFSKIAGPGVRTGWAEGTAKLAWGISQVGSSKSGGAPSQLTATFMSKLLESGDLERHIYGTLQPAYARRYRIMISAIRKHLIPLGVTLPQDNQEVVGGYFIWIILPKPLRAAEATLRSKRDQNLIIMPGHMFAVWGDERVVDLDRGVRLTFSWEEEDRLEEGIKRLSAVVHQMQYWQSDACSSASTQYFPTLQSF